MILIHRFEEITLFFYLGILSIRDVRTKSVPFWGLGVGVLLVCFFRGMEYVFMGTTTGWNELLGVLPGVGLILLAGVTKGVGRADGFVCMILGAYQGFRYSISIFCCALFFAAVFAVFGIMIWGWERNKKLPFIPFLFLSFFLIGAV